MIIWAGILHFKKRDYEEASGLEPAGRLGSLYMSLRFLSMHVLVPSGCFGIKTNIWRLKVDLSRIQKYFRYLRGEMVQVIYARMEEENAYR